MSDVSGGPGWWQASDGKWYAPELHPDAAPRTQPAESASSADVFAAPSTNDVFASPMSDSPTTADNVFAAPFAEETPIAPQADVFAAPASPPPPADVIAPGGTDNLFAGSPDANQGSAAAPSIQYPTYAKSNAKSKVIAGVLAILLGWLGIHRFYLGFKKLGIAMLLITVLSLGALIPLVVVWGVIEGVLILIGKFAHDAYGDALA
jgi:TM2 domain-containing membrane protein YozV